LTPPGIGVAIARVARDLPIPEDSIRRAFEAWNEGDFEKLMALSHPDVEYQPGIVVGPAAGEPVVYRGRDEMRQFFEEWHSQWQMQISVDAIEDLGEERALILGRARMTGAQSGVTLEQEVAWLGEGEEGLMRRLYSYPSHAEARAAAEGS
jgi:ketosteroid isomerase-like protein